MSPKSSKIVFRIITGLLAVLFIVSGGTKLAGAEMQIKNFESWGYPLWLRFPIGISEILFAIGLFMPKFQKYVLYSIFIWTVVAVYTHLQAGQAQMIGAPIVFSVLAGIALYAGKTVSPTS